MCLTFVPEYAPCDIQTYQTVKGVLDDYDRLADLFELVEHFLNHLDIYTKIPPTVSVTEIIIKILHPRIGDQTVTARKTK
jgi:hypothetical protein